MKVKKLRLKNFQSARDIEIEFDEKGVTRFSGPNNIGKSVMLKGLSALMQNVSNRNYKEFIRDDEDSFEVRMEDFEGNWVHLSRGGVDFYSWSIDGKEGRVDRTGGRVPIELQKYFNLYVEEEKTGECLNIRLPGDQLLFVDTTAGDNAMMFQKALGTEEYMLGVKEVDRKGRQLNKEIKLVEKYLEQEETKLTEAQSEVVHLRESIGELDRYEQVLVEESKRYQDLEEIEEETREFIELNRELKGNKEILQGLREGVDKDEVSLSSVQKGLEDLVQVEALYKEMEKYENEKSILTVQKDKVNTVGEIDLEEDFDIYKQLSKVISEYEEIEQMEEKLSKVDIEAIKEVDVEVYLFNLVKVNEVINDVEGMSELRKGIKDNRERLETMAQELTGIEAELGQCPTCGSSFPHEH